MSINIGAEMMAAVVELRGNRDFERMLDALADYAQREVYAAIAGPVDKRVDQTAHARALHDIWEGLTAAYAGLNPAQIKPKPQPRTRMDMSQ